MGPLFARSLLPPSSSSHHIRLPPPPVICIRDEKQHFLYLVIFTRLLLPSTMIWIFLYLFNIFQYYRCLLLSMFAASYLSIPVSYLLLSHFLLHCITSFFRFFYYLYYFVAYLLLDFYDTIFYLCSPFTQFSSMAYFTQCVTRFFLIFFFFFKYYLPWDPCRTPSQWMSLSAGPSRLPWPLPFPSPGHRPLPAGRLSSHPHQR
jgi:hypothetical protein